MELNIPKPKAALKYQSTQTPKVQGLGFRLTPDIFKPSAVETSTGRSEAYSMVAELLHAATESVAEAILLGSFYNQSAKTRMFQDCETRPEHVKPSSNEIKYKWNEMVGHRLKMQSISQTACRQE